VYGAGIGAINALQAGNYTLSDGSTGLSAVDGSAGLVLDGLGTVGAELVPTSGNWTAETGAIGFITTNTPASVTFTSAGAGTAYASIFTGATVGNTYDVSFTVSGYSGGGVDVVVGFGTLKTYVSANGTYSRKSVCAGNAALYVYCQAATTATVVVNSIKQVTGIPATQSTAGNRPTLRRGALNLLIQSNDFSNAAWGKAGSPTVGANSVARTLNAATFLQSAAASISIGVPFTQQIKARANTVGGRLGLRVGGSYPDRVDAVFDLVAGTVVGSLNGGAFTGVSASISAVDADGFYKCIVRGTAAGTAATVAIFGPTDSTLSVGGWEANSAILSNCFVKEGQLEIGSIASDYSPTTSAAASNPSAGRYSWEFDGTNDSLALGSVPFQSTEDHLVIVAGYVSTVAAGSKPLVSNYGTTNRRVAQISVETATITATWTDNAATAGTSPTGVVTTVGTPFVATAWKVGNSKTLRVNGATINTSVTAMGTTTLTNSAIGTDGVSVHAGNESQVYQLKGTFTAAEVLVLERFAALTLPNAPTF
jgi:hypothetical protein